MSEFVVEIDVNDPDFLTKALAAASNGREKIGFTHLTDAGLPTKYWVVTDLTNLGCKTNTDWVYTPDEFHASDAHGNLIDMGDAKAVADGALSRASLWRNTCEANTYTYLEWCREKRIPVDMCKAVAHFAIASRSLCAVTGCFEGEGRHAADALDGKPAEGKHDGGDITRWGALADPYAFTKDGLVKLAAKAMSTPWSMAAIPGILRTTNWFETNHATVGGRLPVGQIRILAHLCGLPLPADPSARAQFNHDFTTAMYPVFHPWSIKVFVEKLIPGSTDKFRQGPSVTRRWFNIATDTWTALHKPRFPAGCAPVNVLKEAMRYIIEDGVIAVFPDPYVVDRLMTDVLNIGADPAPYHPGAMYLGVVPRTINASRYKENMKHAAKYLQVTGRGLSLLASPSMADALTQGTTGTWDTVCNYMSTALTVEEVKTALDALKRANMVTGAKVDLKDMTAINAINKRANALASVDLARFDAISEADRLTNRGRSDSDKLVAICNLTQTPAKEVLDAHVNTPPPPPPPSEAKIDGGGHSNDAFEPYPEFEGEVTQTFGTQTSSSSTSGSGTPSRTGGDAGEH